MSYKVFSKQIMHMIYSITAFNVVMDKEDMLITFEEHIRNLEKVTGDYLLLLNIITHRKKRKKSWKIKNEKEEFIERTEMHFRYAC